MFQPEATIRISIDPLINAAYVVDSASAGLPPSHSGHQGYRTSRHAKANCGPFLERICSSVCQRGSPAARRVQEPGMPNRETAVYSAKLKDLGVSDGNQAAKSRPKWILDLRSTIQKYYTQDEVPVSMDADGAKWLRALIEETGTKKPLWRRQSSWISDEIWINGLAAGPRGKSLDVVASQDQGLDFPACVRHR